MPDGIFFISQIKIWVNFGGPWNGIVGILYGHWE
jgi:hypothetical protein